MIRVFTSALIILSTIIVGFSQPHIIPSLYEVPSTSERMDSLLSVINDRENELEQIKKDKARADSLDVLVGDYALLVNLWQNEYQQVKKTSDNYNSLACLLSESDSIFNMELPDVSIVPASLKNHFNLIKQVISIQSDIEKVKNEIDEKSKACIALNQDPIAVIPQLISADIDAIYEQIAAVKETGLPSFSDVQKKYFDDNIRGEYNNFEKYFTNE